MLDFKVPLDRRKNQLAFKDYNGSEVEPWEFEATLHYKGYERGRSAFNIVWRDEKKRREYRSSMILLDAVLRGSLKRNDAIGIKAWGYNEEGRLFIVGKFGFKKQGTSVLLKSIQ